MRRPPTVVITGATSGLGRLAAFALARQGVHLGIIARSQRRADATRAEILAAAPGTEVDIFLADFARMNDVRRVGAQIAAHYDRIDVLINNAGLHAFAQRITADGYPEMVAVNYFAAWLLTRALLPTLIGTQGARIVNVASEASRRHGTLRLPDDLTDTSSFTARGSSMVCGKTKLLNIMFTLELARRLEGTDVTANCLNPGFNVTGLGRELPFAAPLERVLALLRIGEPRRGAGLIVRIATDLSFAGRSGGYYSGQHAKPISPVSTALDAVLQAELWSHTERLLNGQPERSQA